MSRVSWFLRMRVGYAPRNGLLASLALALLSSACALASPESKKPLHIFFVDIEGGHATLFVTPEQHALLIDTDWPGNNGRDTDRIVGGLPQLVARIPVGAVIDHGDNRESTDAPTVQVWQAEFIPNPEGPDAWPDGALKSSIPARKTPSAIQHPGSQSGCGEERRRESLQNRSH